MENPGTFEFSTSFPLSKFIFKTRILTIEVKVTRFENTITTLGVLAATTGLASSVHAQLAVASNSEAGDFTLSGVSLIELESKIVEDDYKSFFAETETTSTISPSNVEDYNNFINPIGGVWELDERVELLVNVPLSEPINPLFSRQAEALNGIERVEVQVELTE